ncbi:MAG TPA: hypothetical protein V6D14_17390 [Coleofasciculaceae cyanobacterium]
MNFHKGRSHLNRHPQFSLTQLLLLIRFTNQAVLEGPGLYPIRFGHLCAISAIADSIALPRKDINNTTRSGRKLERVYFAIISSNHQKCDQDSDFAVSEHPVRLS